DGIFIFSCGLMYIIAGLVYPYSVIPRWVGFALAGYSAIANDSIQTIGTFIATNEDKRWWVLWLFIGGIFFATVFYSWYMFDGDVSNQRLAAKGFSVALQSFSFLQIDAPI